MTDARALRLALFSGNYNYIRDGANQALNRLVGYLLDYGAAARVYSPTVAAPAFAPTGELVGVPALALPGGRGEYRLALGLPATVRRNLAGFAPNLVQVSAPDILGHRAVAWARRQRLPVVASLHTRFETYLRYYGLSAVEPIVIKLLTRFYNRVDQVVVPTPSVAALIARWGVKTPIGIWSRGIDHDRFNPSRRDLTWRRSLGIADGDMVVGFLGRLVKEKGLDIFAEVAQRLRADGVAHRILVIGEGPARHWFEREVPDAIFTGFQSGDELGRAVAGMDVLFNPSVTETFGNVTTEAMAAGVPVVAARATGAVDLIDDGVNGFLVPPRAVAAYADAIARVVGDPELRAAMGAVAARKAATFQWDSANEAMLDIMTRVVAHARR